MCFTIKLHVVIVGGIIVGLNGEAPEGGTCSLSSCYFILRVLYFILRFWSQGLDCKVLKYLK